MGTKQLGGSEYGKESATRCHDEQSIEQYDERKNQKISPFMQLASMF
jgi:hypothetical protein